MPTHADTACASIGEEREFIPSDKQGRRAKISLHCERY